MALINCKNCGNSVSDRAAFCPHCGASLKQEAHRQAQATSAPTSTQPQPKHKSTLPVVIIILVLLLGCGAGGWYYYSHLSNRINVHEFVDLGLSVKWATCNVGASSPEEYGNYYAWGETRTKSSYDDDNCKTWNLYTFSIEGDPDYDAARSNWGGKWRMPTEEEMDELVEKCSWEWTTLNGHNGYMITGPNGNSIFLPAAGGRYGTSLNHAGEGGGYWSASPDESDSQCACFLFFRSDDFDWGWLDRSLGFSVRPVSE